MRPHELDTAEWLNHYTHPQFYIYVTYIYIHTHTYK